MFLPHPRVKVSIVGSLRDREVACSASDRQGSNFESCVWRTVSSQSSHHPQEVLLAQFSLYVHKGGLNPDSFHFLGRIAIFVTIRGPHGNICDYSWAAWQYFFTIRGPHDNIFDFSCHITRFVTSCGLHNIICDYSSRITIFVTIRGPHVNICDYSWAL